MISALNPFNSLSFPCFGVQNLKKSNLPLDATNQNTLYFDFCTMQYWELTTPTKLETYMSDLMTQLSDAKITQINLAFAQVNNINSMLNKQSTDPQSNLFGYILNNYPDVLPAFVSTAQKFNIHVSLSFGGQFASAQAMQICSGGETAESQALNLVSLLNLYKLDGVDFDLENGGDTNFITQNKETALPFLKKLHEELSSQGKTVTLTTSVNHSVIDTLSLLFFDSTGAPQLKQFFDGLNLMTYDSGAHYYIDACDDDYPNVVWGLQKWLETVSKENASLIHIGFQDATPYENPSVSAGIKYTISTTDRGQAGVEIYQQNLKNLQKNNASIELGAPFWWPDEGSMSSRYQIDPTGHTNFQTETIKSFYQALNPSFFKRFYERLNNLLT